MLRITPLNPSRAGLLSSLLLRSTNECLHQGKAPARLSRQSREANARLPS